MTNKETCMEDLRHAESILEELKYMQKRTRIDPTGWRETVCSATAAVMVALGHSHEDLNNAKILDHYRLIEGLCRSHKVMFGPKLKEAIEYSFQPEVIKQSNHLGSGGVEMSGILGQTEAIKYVHACKKLLVAMKAINLGEYNAYVNKCIENGEEKWLTKQS